MERDPRQSNRDRDEGRGPRNWIADPTSVRLTRLERMVNQIGVALNLNFERDIAMSIKFEGLTAALERTKGAGASTRKLVDQMNAKLSELSASIENPEDQKKVDEFAAAFAAEAEGLPDAVEANPDAGASMDGVTT